MAEDKNLFGMLDGISSSQDEILSEITGVKHHVINTEDKIAELEKEIKRLKTEQVESKTKQVPITPEMSEKAKLQTFLKRAKKSWMWFGNNAEFKRGKWLAIISLILLLVLGLVATIVSSICFKLYSTFTLFENAWMVFAIFYLTYVLKTQKIYEVNALAAKSSYKYEVDNVGMLFPRKEKVFFRIFRWLALASPLANIICIWAGMGVTNKGAATFVEILFLGAVVFAYFMISNLFEGYSIIYVEGNNLVTNDRVVFVFPPDAKELIPEEEFKKKMPYFYQ